MRLNCCHEGGRISSRPTDPQVPIDIFISRNRPPFFCSGPISAPPPLTWDSLNSEHDGKPADEAMFKIFFLPRAIKARDLVFIRYAHPLMR